MRRRSVVIAALAGAFTSAFAVGRTPALAEEATPVALANHPAVGAWNSMTPGGPAIGIFFPDGTNLVTLPATQAGPQGMSFVSTQAGRWEPISERRIHFTSVQFHSDANGVYTGSVTVDGYPEVSEDGLTLIDDQSLVVVTLRDATGTILQEIPGAGSPPVTGVRMAVGAPNFPPVAVTTGTPTS
jgi:hypothetical protein